MARSKMYGSEISHQRAIDQAYRSDAPVDIEVGGATGGGGQGRERFRYGTDARVWSALCQRKLFPCCCFSTVDQPTLAMGVIIEKHCVLENNGNQQVFLFTYETPNYAFKTTP